MASESYWQELIELWERSGLKQSEFCRQHNLGKSTFSKRISIHRELSGVNYLVRFASITLSGF